MSQVPVVDAVRRALLIAGVAVAAGVASFAITHEADAKANLAIGKPAPDFSGTDSTGKPVKLGDLKGKTVVLEWTNHDCPYVVKHYSGGNMQALQKEAAAQGVVWLSIISSAPGEQGHVDGKRADDLTAKRGAAPTAVVLDPSGSIGRLYDARTTPHMFVIDRTGVLQYMGGIDDKATSNAADIKTSKNYVRLALASVAKGEKVADAVTRPYGCSVKYR
jgi:peroxiredoxin